MRVPIVDLKAQHEAIKEEVDAAILKVIQNGQFILGPEVGTLEEEIANLVQGIREFVKSYEPLSAKITSPALPVR